MANGCRAQIRDVGGMGELLPRLARGEVVRPADPETEPLLPSVDHLTENIAHAADPVAELRSWWRLLVALTDHLAEGPFEPDSPRDRVLRTMVGKTAGLTSAALHQASARSLHVALQSMNVFFDCSVE